MVGHSFFYQMGTSNCSVICMCVCVCVCVCFSNLGAYILSETFPDFLPTQTVINC